MNFHENGPRGCQYRIWCVLPLAEWNTKWHSTYENWTGRCMLAGWQTKKFPVVSSRRLLLRNLLILRQLVKLWSSSLITYINLFSHPCHTLGRHKFQRQFMPVNIWLTKISANTWYQYFLIQVILLLLFFFLPFIILKNHRNFLKTNCKEKKRKH